MTDYSKKIFTSRIKTKQRFESETIAFVLSALSLYFAARQRGTTLDRRGPHLTPSFEMLLSPWMKHFMAFFLLAARNTPFKKIRKFYWKNH